MSDSNSQARHHRPVCEHGRPADVSGGACPACRVKEQDLYREAQHPDRRQEMTLGEAREKIAAAVQEVKDEGFEVWLYLDAIMVGHMTGESSWIDPTDTRDRPSATPNR